MSLPASRRFTKINEEGTKGQRHKGTKKDRHKDAKAQRDRGTKRQRKRQRCTAHGAGCQGLPAMVAVQKAAGDL